MRKRYEYSSASAGFPEDLNLGATKRKTSIHSVPFYVGLVVVFILLGLYGAVYLIDRVLPTPLQRSDEKTHPDAFITERARHDLKVLTDLGPRISGGYENDVLAADFIKRQVDFISQGAHKNQKIELDVQIVTGSHYLSVTPSGKISTYSNLQNIVVKLHGRNNTQNSLLVNAHFDSVPTSPGGSDDGINCVAMLEVLRKLSRKPERPTHNVLFLFNGAEEIGLPASHGFTSQHKWAKECRVVVNLEAVGAGGKIILFQTGPATPWLLSYYSKVPHPYGQAAGEEIFQSNIIPSDTDFRIFRDYGGMVGLDMAFFESGYRYHTKYDDFVNIPGGSYQHVGDNVLFLVSNLANAPELTEAEARTEKSVYYDVLGWFMITYTQSTGNIINYIVALFSVIVSGLNIYSLKIGYTKQTLKYLVLTFGAVVGGWILSGVFIYLLALFLDGMGYSMSWYAHPWIVIGLYVAPTVALSGILLPLIKHEKLNDNIKCHIQAHTVRLIWTFVLFVGTALGLRTSYTFMILVVFNAVAFLTIFVFNLQHTVRTWQIIYLIGIIIPSIFMMYNALTTMALFVPTTGRIGPDKNPEIIIGMISLLFTVLVTSPFVALVTLLRNFRYFLAFMAAIFLVHFIIVFTPLGFPYTGDPRSPAPQRYWIIHSRRVFHNQFNNETEQDSGYFLLNMDRNSPSRVEPYAKELVRARTLEEDCNHYLLCGLPLVHPKMIQIMQYSTWVPAGPPLIPEPVTLRIISKLNLSPTVIRYNVSISGPDRKGVYLSPKSGNEIIQMSLLDAMPPKKNTAFMKGRPVYFIFHTYGARAAPLTFTFDVKVAHNSSGATTEIAVSGIFVHDSVNRRVPHFQQFLNQFPDWADVTAWLGTYELWWV